MSKITICGLVNLETTVPVDEFPIEYSPISYKFFGITTHPSGVGLNLSSALKSLGDDVNLLTLCADDTSGNCIRDFLESQGISTENVLTTAKSTAQSVVLYDNSGRRRVYCDLTDMQDNAYDAEIFEKSSTDSDIAVLCNINFSRPLIRKAKDMGLVIATDVHCLSDINDEYNTDFIRAADILFLSNENFIGKEEEFVSNLKSVTNAEVIVVGMGIKGALLYLKSTDAFEVFPAVYTRKVVNTVGAGDSLFASFLHFYAKTKDPRYSLRLATVFASYKIGDTSACRGFLDEESLIKLSKEIGE